MTDKTKATVTNKSGVEEIKSAVVAAVELKAQEQSQVIASQNETINAQATEIKELQTTVSEVKNLAGDLEAKFQNQHQNVEIKETNVEFDTKALNVALRNTILECKNGNKDLASIETKGLAVGGGGGEALAIDEELGRRVIERARENVAILGMIGRRSVSSTDYREMVLRGYPATAAVAENIAGTAAHFTATDTQTYEEVVMRVAKQYAKPYITDEAAADPHIDLMSHLERLLSEEFARYWAIQVIQGNGTTNNFKGILSSARVDADELAGESYKDNSTRDFDFYKALASGHATDIGDPADAATVIDNLIDMTVELPTNYLAGSTWTMNRRTLGRLRKLKDLEGRPYIQFETGGFTLLGHAVNIEDYMPNITAGSKPIIFGKLAEAFAMIDIDDKFLLDPYSKDGAVQIKATSRKGEMVLHNDAIVIMHVGVPI